MSDPRPANMPWMIPYLTVQDAGEAAQFYHIAFGFEVESTAPNPDDEDKIAHAELRYKDMVIMCGSENAWGNPNKTPLNGKFLCPISLYVYVDDVDAFHDKLKELEVEIVQAPEDTFWGDRMMAAADLDGYTWSFATRLPEAE